MCAVHISRMMQMRAAFSTKSKRPSEPPRLVPMGEADRSGLPPNMDEVESITLLGHLLLLPAIALHC